MDKGREDLEQVIKIIKFMVIVDFIMALVCAANGLDYFAYFMLLAGGMWAWGSYFQSKLNETGGE